MTSVPCNSELGLWSYLGERSIEWPWFHSKISLRLYCDSQNVIAIVVNQVLYKCTKHIICVPEDVQGDHWETTCIG